MKTKGFILALSVGIILPLAYQITQAQSNLNVAGSKMAVVSIQKIFQQCQTNAKYRQQAALEQEQALAELDQLTKEIEAQKAGLNTLKPGSTDYLQSMHDILKKQGELEAKREFTKQSFALKDQQWTMKIYTDILRIVNEVAQQKGLDLVLEKNEPELLDSTPANELMLTIRTHKVLYSGGCQDITDEIIARLDAGS
ncbi:MAG: OmpH/Skp family outer membrane protein [Planctomycetota bacterium]|jgi:Skp family chaperone for outer membrane proteins